MKYFILSLLLISVFSSMAFANTTVTDSKVNIGTYSPDGGEIISFTAGKGYHLDNWYNAGSFFLIQIQDIKTKKQITIGKLAVTGNTTLEFYPAEYKGSRTPIYNPDTSVTLTNTHTMWNEWSYAGLKIDALIDVETEAGDGTPEAVSIFNIRGTPGKEPDIKAIIKSYYAAPEGTTPPAGGKHGAARIDFSSWVDQLKNKGFSNPIQAIKNSITVTEEGTGRQITLSAYNDTQLSLADLIVGKKYEINVPKITEGSKTVTFKKTKAIAGPVTEGNLD